MMQAQELRKKTADELSKTLHELLKEQFNLRMQRGGPESNVRPHTFGVVRRNIARVKTMMRELTIGTEA